MKKLIIQIILAGIIIFLGYKCYESIKIPQQFKVIKEQRYARIADRLKDIRTAQEAYKGVYGKYTGSFDTLINFIKYDSVKVVRSIGSLSDEDLEKGITEAQAIKEGRIVRDTVHETEISIQYGCLFYVYRFRSRSPSFPGLDFQYLYL